MVHNRTSTGCHRCRRQHKHCDRTRPGCRRCDASGIECPGYRDVGGYIFKDQTNQVSSRQQQQVFTSCQHSKPLLFATALVKDDPGITSVFFFFQTFLNHNRNSDTSRGHFDHLSRLYHGASPSSPLVLATQYMAAQSAAIALQCYTSALPFLNKSHLRAVQSLRREINNHGGAASNATVLAVLVLDFADQISYRSGGRVRPRDSTHAQGALALLEQRKAGAGQSKDEEKELWPSILSATRSTIIHFSIASNTASSSTGTLKLPRIHAFNHDWRKQNPALSLDDIIADILRLSKRSAELLSGDYVKNQELAAAACDLNRQTLEWWRALPLEWLPTPKSSGLAGPEEYPSLDVAFIFNQWRCTRLMVLKLMLAFGVPKCAEYAEVYSVHKTANAIVQALCNSAAYFDRDRPAADSQIIFGLGWWYLEDIVNWALWVFDEFMEDTELQVDPESLTLLRNRKNEFAAIEIGENKQLPSAA